MPLDVAVCLVYCLVKGLQQEPLSPESQSAVADQATCLE